MGLYALCYPFYTNMPLISQTGQARKMLTERSEVQIQTKDILLYQLQGKNKMGILFYKRTKAPLYTYSCPFNTVLYRQVCGRRDDVLSAVTIS